LAAQFFLKNAVRLPCRRRGNFFAAKWVPYFPPAARGNFFSAISGALWGPPKCCWSFPLGDISLHQAGLRMGGAADWPASEISVYGFAGGAGDIG